MTVYQLLINLFRARVVDDSTIILIFDGINMFVDPETGEEANVALWFPQYNFF